MADAMVSLFSHVLTSNGIRNVTTTKLVQSNGDRYSVSTPVTHLWGKIGERLDILKLYRELFDINTLAIRNVYVQHDFVGEAVLVVVLNI
jgi:hypothetical protein